MNKPPKPPKKKFGLPKPPKQYRRPSKPEEKKPEPEPEQTKDPADTEDLISSMRQEAADTVKAEREYLTYLRRKKWDKRKGREPGKGKDKSKEKPPPPEKNEEDNSDDLQSETT